MVINMLQKIISSLLAVSCALPGSVGYNTISSDSVSEPGSIKYDQLSADTNRLDAVDSKPDEDSKDELEGSDTAVSERLIAELEYDYAFKGEGMCIAVLDTGFYLEHESFILTTEGRLTKEQIDRAELSFVPEASCYVSEKIPFAYNYADGSSEVGGLASHGTAVLSAVGQNNAAAPEHQNGAAPEAQLLAMKVFSDKSGEASTEAMVSAINDSIVLGADVICIAFGSECGSDIGIDELEKALESARSAGIIVVSSVGEVREIGAISPYGTDAALIMPTTDSPDVGTVSYPASSSNTLAVSSANTNVYSADCFLLDGEKIPYGDTCTMWEKPSGGVSFAKFFNDQTLSYEFVPQYGKKEDLEGLDLTGKLAVIERGVITFAEKCQNAAEHGAVGVIIIDDQPDQNSALVVRMDISESPIPAVIISSKNGERLKSSSSRTITIKQGLHYYALSSDTPTPSSYASWGTTPSLGLSPDISVAADAIECASSDGGYITTGGTSIAAARLSGMLACLKEKLIASGFGETEAAERAKALLASSAEPMRYGDEYYSPRSQGSGAASLGNALSAELLLTSNGEHKIELRELSSRVFTLEIDVENLSDEKKFCTLEALVGSDGYSTFLYNEIESSEAALLISEKLGKEPTDEVSFISRFTAFESATIYSGNEAVDLNMSAEDGKTLEFTIEPGKKVHLELTVVIDRETMSEYEKTFPNGFFVEGYVFVGSDGESASIPFVGFMDDFSRAEALDSELYSDIYPLYDSIYLWRELNIGTLSERVILGKNPLDPSDGEADRDRLLLSPRLDAANASVYLNLALLRSIDAAVVRVFDGDELIYENDIGYIPRTYLDYTTNMVISPQIKLWDGRAADNAYYIYPDGTYTVTLSYKTVGLGKEKSTSFELILDSTKPELKAYEFFEKGERAFLKTDAFDENGISSCFVCDELSNEAELTEDGWEITMLGKYIYIELFDYAANSRVVRLDNPYFVEYYE